jgi:acylphosphatase
MPATMETVRIRITGRVQGVGYRLWAMRMAAGLGLRGWVRNRNDGSVEVLATGQSEAVAAMIEACRNGPAGARVTGVTAAPGQDDGSAGFESRPTD